MKCTIEIKMDNAAFCDNGHDIDRLDHALYAGGELARILRELADKINEDAQPGTSCGAFDVNGNCVGFLKISGRRLC